MRGRLLALWLWPLGLVSRVAAQEPPPVEQGPGEQVSGEQAPDSEASAKERGWEFYERGASLYEQGKLAQALALFQQAREAWPSWQAYHGIGLAHQDLNQPVQALDAYHLLLEKFASELGKGRLVVLRERIEQLEALVGVLRVEASQPGVEVSIDGEPLGKGAFRRSIFVLPGVHHIDAHKPGHVSRRLSLSVRPRDQHEIEIELVPIVKAAPEPPPQPSTPDPGGQRSLPADEPKPWVWQPWALVGGGALLGAGGGVLLTLAADDRTSYSRQIDRATAGQSTPVIVDTTLDQRADDRQLLGTVLLLGGGLAVLGGVSWMLFTSEAEPSNVALSVGPRGRRLLLSGRF